MNEESLRDRIISIYGYNGYLRCLSYLADIAELSKVANTNAYSPYFLSTLKKRAYVSSLLSRGNEGYVLEDIDLVLVRWSNNDRLGRFKLLEFKENQHYLDKSQRLTFGLIDKMLKSLDESYRYEGLYLINIVDNKTIVSS